MQARLPFVGERRLSLVALGLLALAACADSIERTPASYHPLTVPQLAPRLERPVLAGLVEVPRVEVFGVHHTRALVSRGPDGRLRRDDRHYWTRAPGRMVQDAILEALRQSNVLRQVTPPVRRGDPRWRVHGRLTRFRHASASTGAVFATVELNLTVVDVRDRTIAIQRSYSSRRWADRPGPSGAAEATGPALAQVLGRFVRDLATSLPRANAKGSAPAEPEPAM